TSTSAIYALSLHDALPISNDMDYVELNVPVADTAQAEIVTALLADFPFESFAEDAGMLKAYIPKEALYGCKEAVDRMLAGFGIRSEEHTSELQSRFDLVCR